MRKYFEIKGVVVVASLKKVQVENTYLYTSPSRGPSLVFKVQYFLLFLRNHFFVIPLFQKIIVCLSFEKVRRKVIQIKER